MLLTSLAGLLLLVYLAVLVALALFSVHRLRLAWASGRPSVRPAVPADDPRPWVTVQVPLYNEREVAGRVIAAAGALRWPADRLQIQVLDDSTDETCERVDAAVAELVARGVDAVVLRRTDRTGFKAGALAAGTVVAKGTCLGVLDADFVPDPDWLERTVPWLGPGVAFVQARWGHLNAEESWLTACEATMLDAHFVLEHGGRWRLGCWFNFNGTAGVWQRRAIEEAGGWQHDTLTEDLDLSYRAQLAGWRAVYLGDVVVPAELPPTMRAFKAQQHRWARGGVQTARKLAVRVARAPVRWGVRVEALTHLLGNVGYPLTLSLAVLLPLLPWARQVADRRIPLAVDLLLFALCVVPLVLAYGVAVVRSGAPGVLGRLLRLPVVLALGIGMAPAQSRAVFAGLLGPVGTFERTPKRGAAAALTYAVRADWGVGAELVLAGWQLVGLGWAVSLRAWGSVPFLLLFAAGLLLTGLGSVRSKG